MTAIGNNVAAATPTPQHTCTPGDFAALQAAIVTHYEAILKNADNNVILTTDVNPDSLYQAYLAGFSDPASSAHHKCSACSHFIRHYGGLVVTGTTEGKGVIKPLMWPQLQNHLEPIYRQPIKNMYALVKAARVTGVFYSADKGWGVLGNRDYVTGAWWNHFHVHNKNVWTSKLLTPNQATAAKLEGYNTVLRALSKYTPKYMALALQLLESNALYRAERVLGPIQWLKNLQEARSKLREPQKSTYTWAMVGAAPEGFLHPTSNVTSSLLDDLVAGLNFEDVKARFAEKMNPVNYQRPQAAPAAGNVRRAEEIFHRLGLSRSLLRRPATFQDLKTVWIPTLAETNPNAGKKPAAIGGVFGHVPTKTYTATPASNKTRMNTGVQTMTWAKFRSTVLPSAEQIDVQVASVGNHIAGFMTAVDLSAPPILSWDLPGARNPVSWYVYVGGSSAIDWNLRSGWVPCIGVTLRPNLWNPEGNFTHMGIGGVFLLEGAYDTRNPGSALFPETLIADLHEVRSVIEGYSNHTQTPKATRANVAGMVFGTSAVRIRVTTATTIGEFIIDRWE